MDKLEYKSLAEQIQELIKQGEYAEAAAIADKIDWRRVRSVMMLGTISDLYKMNCRYEDARDILLLAYDRKPENRQICYSLCELYIKTGEMVEAVEFYKEFVQLAPKDPGRYVLQYKLYEANDVSLEERIEVLEELKKHEYQEKWMYELAYLYHRLGLATKCVEECDELVLWFGSGKYVNKALELKMLHAPLTELQQQKYENRFQPVEEPVSVQEEEEQAEVSQTSEEPEQMVSGETRVFDAEEVRRQMQKQAEQEEEDELDIQVKTMDMSQYNTMNLQEALAQGLKEVLEQDGETDPVTRAIIAPMMEDNDTGALDMPAIEEIDENDLGPEIEEMEDSEVYFGETGEISQAEVSYEEPVAEAETPEDVEEKIDELVEEAQSVAQEPTMETGEIPGVEPIQEPSIGNIVMEQMRRETMSELEQQAMVAQPPEKMAKVLTQESDGQIRLVIPESKNLEKQITGQISIEDIRAEWERMKQESKEKQEEEVRQQVLRQTGKMFTEFEEALRDNILEQMEKNGESDLLKMVEGGKEPELQETEAEDDSPETEWEALGDTDINDIAEEPAQEPVKEEPAEVAEEVTEEKPEETTEETTEEPAEAAAEEATEEPAEAAAEEVTEEPAEAAAEEATEEPTEAAAEEATKEPTEAAAEEVTEEPAAPHIEDALMEDSWDETEEEASEEPVEEETEVRVEEPADKTTDEASDEDEDEEEGESHEAEDPDREQVPVRALTREERELYNSLVQGRKGREQLVKAIDNISMAAYTGNLIITGEGGLDTLALAKNMIREIQASDSNFSGKVAKISGVSLNKRPASEIVENLKNGALIIEKATKMNDETAEDLYKCLQQENYGIIVVMEDDRKVMNKFLKSHGKLKSLFTARMDMQPLSDDALASFGRQYARENEFSIDALGMLALHTRIDEMQTADHAVTIMDVKEIVDEAIYHASRKTISHFFDILLGKRYDDEDMIILTEKDFN